MASTRAGNVIGGGDMKSNRIIPDIIKSFRNKTNLTLRNPNATRPWQHVLEPLHGYLILAKKLYENPLKFSSGWNFGSEKNTVTDVVTVVKKIIKIWGKGKLKFTKRNKYYEQKNLQLNISKAKKKLSWKPKLSIFDSINFTVEWYKQTLIHKKNPYTVTKNQIKEFLNL